MNKKSSADKPAAFESISQWYAETDVVIVGGGGAGIRRHRSGRAPQATV